MNYAKHIYLCDRCLRDIQPHEELYEIKGRKRYYGWSLGTVQYKKMKWIKKVFHICPQCWFKGEKK
jgi:hypothetical protein